MSDWIRRHHAKPEAWHKPGRRANDHTPDLVVTRCGVAWSAQEPVDVSAGTEPGLDERCHDCEDRV